jgi:hypothetical protein
VTNTVDDAAAPIDSVESTVTAGGSSLTYDPTRDQYTYVWKTEKAWAGQCRGPPCGARRSTAPTSVLPVTVVVLICLVLPFLVLELVPDESLCLGGSKPLNHSAISRSEAF